MTQLLWDASALVKRYLNEIGNDVVNAVFTIKPPPPMLTTYMGYAETAAILRRKLNQGVLDLIDFTQTRALLQREVLTNPDFGLLTIDDADVLIGIALTDRHNLNSTDAAILAAYLRYARTPSAPVCILIASDLRLLRAAAAEGLQMLNPELVSAADASTLLTTR